MSPTSKVAGAAFVVQQAVRLSRLGCIGEQQSKLATSLAETSDKIIPYQTSNSIPIGYDLTYLIFV